jgi:flagellar basal body rod protein FlgG
MPDTEFWLEMLMRHVSEAQLATGALLPESDEFSQTGSNDAAGSRRRPGAQMAVALFRRREFFDGIAFAIDADRVLHGTRAGVAVAGTRVAWRARMDAGLYNASAALRAGEQRLESIANNIANVSTRGYKRETTFTHALRASRAGGSQVATRGSSDLSQGQLETTGNPFDLALEGRGWFAIETPGGRAYSRDGSFHLDDRGALVTADGYPVAWKGQRGVLKPAGESVVINSDGRVNQGQSAIGQLDIVDIEDPSSLAPVGSGRWIAPPNARELPAKAFVRQGSAENSNVEAMDELVALITVQRSFESAATAVRTIEQSYRRLNQPRQ